MRIGGRCLLVILLNAVLAGGCAVNPVSGRPEFVLVSAAKEKEIGEEAARNVAQTMTLSSDPALVAYVGQIGRRLAEHSPRRDVEYRFFVVEEQEPNAFALPGGYIYVTRGLLVLVNSEDELAGVLGHEIGHVAARHAVQQVSRAAPFAIVTGIGAGLTSLASPLLGELVGGIGGLASGLVLSPFSRDQEREADRVGQEMSAKSGWDPAAMADFLTTLERDQRQRGQQEQRFDFLATHPSTPERVANTAEYARTLERHPPHPIVPTRDAFLALLDGLVIGPGAAEGVFQGQVFLQPDLDFRLRFPTRWQTQNTPRQVAAVAPDGSALIVLTSLGESNDPLDGARAFERRTKAVVLDKTQEVRSGTLKAAHTQFAAHTPQGDLSVEVAWIVHRGHVYQVVGMTPLPRQAVFSEVFGKSWRSFRPLHPAERASVFETRLRIATAREDETIAALVRRVNTIWSVDTVAIANGLPDDARLRDGQQVKVAVVEPYERSSPSGAVTRPSLSALPTQELADHDGQLAQCTLAVAGIRRAVHRR